MEQRPGLRNSAIMLDLHQCRAGEKPADDICEAESLILAGRADEPPEGAVNQVAGPLLIRVFTKQVLRGTPPEPVR